MMILGRLASAAGLVGVAACSALVPLAWVVRRRLARQPGRALAGPEAGLDAITVVEPV